ncbi:MAG: molecular chaperone TorD family protein [Candidatus Sedimenticola sp. (ex Thyasira tokunagai)]
MGTDWKESANSATSRSGVYGLLTTVFREEPTEAFINDLRGPRLSGVFSEMDVDLGESFFADPESTVAEALAVEFTRLFIGPGRHISAHESIFTEVDGDSGSLWGAKTVEVKKFIETTGIDYEAGFSGLPDHVSVELEFMHKLSEWEADKWLHGDRKSAEYCQSVQRMFLEKHLLCWLPQLCDAVMDQAEMPFYRAMAELTKSYIELERQDMAIEIAA